MREARMLSVIAEAVRLAADPTVTVGLVRSGSRQRKSSHVRDRAMAAIRILRPELLLKEIGGVFDLDHSSVSVALKRHAARAAASLDEAQELNRLVNVFKPDAISSNGPISNALDEAEKALAAANTAFKAARDLLDLAYADLNSGVRP